MLDDVLDLIDEVNQKMAKRYSEIFERNYLPSEFRYGYSIKIRNYVLENEYKVTGYYNYQTVNTLIDNENSDDYESYIDENSDILNGVELNELLENAVDLLEDFLNLIENERYNNYTLMYIAEEIGVSVQEISREGHINNFNALETLIIRYDRVANDILYSEDSENVTLGDVWDIISEITNVDYSVVEGVFKRHNQTFDDFMFYVYSHDLVLDYVKLLRALSTDSTLEKFRMRIATMF